MAAHRCTARGLLAVVALLLGFLPAALSSALPAPFGRELTPQEPPLRGPDVALAQTLLSHTSYPPAPTGAYDASTAFSVRRLRAAHGLPSGDALDAAAANALLECCQADTWVDPGITAASLGLLYKIHVPVHANRSVETQARLLDANNKELLTFRARAHGHDDAGAPKPWPSYSSTPGLTSFAHDGNTPTGLMLLDLNGPEPEPKLYGPWPVNRVVAGLQGNAAFLVPSYRDGLLLHTGEWPGWSPARPMPNSAGCIHAAPEDVRRIAQLLENLGVVARTPNPGGVRPYPFHPQGLLSVELVPEAE